MMAAAHASSLERAKSHMYDVHAEGGHLAPQAITEALQSSDDGALDRVERWCERGDD